MVKNFPGKYMGCQSFTAAMGMGEAKKCTSWQCNVTLGELRTAYVMGAGKCANRPVEDICDNKIPIDVGSCARQMKTANVFDTNAQLRPKVIDCVRKVNPTEYSEAKLTTDCLNCFVDVADCAGEKCLFECLDTDNADCDACRIRNKCDQNVFTCGGLPNTF